MRTEIYPGINGYSITLIFDDRDRCVHSSDSEGRTSEHVYNKDGHLVETKYGSGFWKKWNHETKKYSDSDGLNFIYEERPIRIFGYHGTTAERARNIIKNGFNADTKHWEQSTGNLFVFANFSGLYSEEYCKNMAKKYALIACKDELDLPAIMKTDVTDAVINKISVDYHDPSYEIIIKESPKLKLNHYQVFN